MLDHAIYKSKLSSKYLNMQFQLYEHPVYKDWFGIISVGQLLIPAEPILTPKFGYVYQLSDLILLNTKYTPIYSIMPASIGRFSLNHQHVTIVADEIPTHYCSFCAGSPSNNRSRLLSVPNVSRASFVLPLITIYCCDIG